MVSHWKTNDHKAPPPPYYAVIFISVKKEEMPGYQTMDDLLMEKASRLPEYLGYSVVSKESQSLFISYWKDKESIEGWRKDEMHRKAKSQAPLKWYKYYHSLICKVENSMEFVEQIDKNQL